jgi:hypothetical protein
LFQGTTPRSTLTGRKVQLTTSLEERVDGLLKISTSTLRNVAPACSGLFHHPDKMLGYAITPSFIAGRKPVIMNRGFEIDGFQPTDTPSDLALDGYKALVAMFRHDDMTSMPVRHTSS